MKETVKKHQSDNSNMERTSTPTDTDEGLIEPLVEEEDVGGSKGGHDPHQPAHVTRPRTQLPQIQPGPRRQKRMFTNTYGPAPRTPPTPGSENGGGLPGGVGSSDEEVDHHPVTHVETVLHRPEEDDNDEGQPVVQKNGLTKHKLLLLDTSAANHSELLIITASSYILGLIFIQT